jgi:integrase
MGHLLATAHREWHLIPANPMQGVRKLREPEGRTRYLSDAELRRLLDACRISESPFLYEYVLAALTTGGRAQEVLGLTWADVDLERGTATFRHTKNKDVRTVALAPDVIELLRARRGIGKGLVFPAPPDPKRPDRPPVPIDLRSAWETALRRAGIADFRIHDLRHTAASYLAMEGASLAEIAAVLGHRTLQMVGRYSHLSEEHTARASSRIADRITRTGGA